MKEKIAVIAGPTAVGKTEVAIAAALALNGEIVSCDSMQLYRGMDIGSAKPTPEERALVRHWLVDEIDPRRPFSVALYQTMAKSAIRDILKRGKFPIITGGTGLYLDSILYEMDFGGTAERDVSYRAFLERAAEEDGPQALHRKLQHADPEAAARIHPNNIRKVIRALEAVRQNGRGIEAFSHVRQKSGEYDPILIGLTRNRQELYQRINRRVLHLMDQGLLQEVKGLLDQGLTEEDIAMKGIGYKEIIAYYHGQYDLPAAIEAVQKNTRHYAKRQMTWFRRYDDMKWFDLTAIPSLEEAERSIIDWIQKRKSS